MTDASNPRLSRRRLLELGGGLTAGALGAGALLRTIGSPGVARADHGLPPSPATGNTVTRRAALAGTDGWMYIPGPAQVGTDGKAYFPDDMARSPQNAYNYGFRDVTEPHARWKAAVESNDLDAADVARQDIYGLKGYTQISSFIMPFDEGEQIEITLYNLGWLQRPDIPDGHTVHWHGFKNATPWFDGVPEMSGAAPINKTYTYFYDCQVPGTYMYHCHWEDVEHIQLGMTGSVWIRPAQSRGFKLNPAFKPALPVDGSNERFIPSGIPLTYLGLPVQYTYNDGVLPDDPKSTYFNREYSFMLMDYDLQQHQKLAHIQQPDWSEFHADAWAMNGRSYPDTIKPNGVLDYGVDLGSGTWTSVQASATTIVQAAITPASPPATSWLQNELTNLNVVIGATTFLIVASAAESTTTPATFTIEGAAADVAAIAANAKYLIVDGPVGYSTGNVGTVDAPVTVAFVTAAVPVEVPTSAPWVDNMLAGTSVGISLAYTATAGDTLTVTGTAADLTALRAIGSGGTFNLGAGGTGTIGSIGLGATTTDVTADPAPSPSFPVGQTGTAFFQTADPIVVVANSTTNADTPSTRVSTLTMRAASAAALAWLAAGRRFALLDTQLAYQPYTSQIACNDGDRVLLRLACLGYQDHSLTMDGIALTIVGRDADWLENNIYTTDTVDVAPGESYDAMFIAPPHSSVSPTSPNGVPGSAPDVYMFYDRNFANDGSGPDTVYTGIATQVRVYPKTTLPAQSVFDNANAAAWIPNDLARGI